MDGGICAVVYTVAVSNIILFSKGGNTEQQPGIEFRLSFRIKMIF